tara:strand:+ start:44 stop:367 length:324 start_codon:yes stop_codon:yes gene_type:complete
MPVIIITNDIKWEDIFNKNLIFKTLTNEHTLRILFMQKIKLAKGIKETVKVYMDNVELDEFNLEPKLYNILKYEANNYMIEFLDINDGYDKKEIDNYNEKVELNKTK